MGNSNEVLLNNQEGESYWVLGDFYTFKVTGKQTNGAFTIMEQVIQPQGGPPPHIHRNEDEAFYILEGKFAFLCEHNQKVFEKGSFVYIPKGTLHTFKNIGEQPGRMIVTITPAGLEEFFYEIGTRAADNPTPPEFDPKVIDKIMELSERYQMEVVLPNSSAKTTASV